MLHLLQFQATYTLAEARAIERLLRADAALILTGEQLLLSMETPGNDGVPRKVLSETDTQGSRVFAGILNHGARAVHHAIQGYETLDVPLISWAGRNLVELRIWSRYASQSLECLRRFHHDSIIDALELAQLQVRALHTSSDADRVQAAAAALDELEGELANSSSATRKRLQVKEIAKEVGAEDYYRTWFGMLSKFSHPTPGLLLHVETGKEPVTADLIEPIFVLSLRAACELHNTAIQCLQIVDTPEQARMP